MATMVLCADLSGTFRDAHMALTILGLSAGHVPSVFLMSARHVFRRVTDLDDGVVLGFCNCLAPALLLCDLSSVQTVELTMPSDIRSFFGGKPGQSSPDAKPAKKEVSFALEDPISKALHFRSTSFDQRC